MGKDNGELLYKSWECYSFYLKIKSGGKRFDVGNHQIIKQKIQNSVNIIANNESLQEILLSLFHILFTWTDLIIVKYATIDLLPTQITDKNVHNAKLANIITP